MNKNNKNNKSEQKVNKVNKMNKIEQIEPNLFSNLIYSSKLGFPSNSNS
jgi:hypothetical protein